MVRKRHSDRVVRPTEALVIARMRMRPRRVHADNFRMAPPALGEQLLAATLAIDAARSRRPDGPLPTDEGWWCDVLLDPRAHTPADVVSFERDSIHAASRLDRQRGPSVVFRCLCGLRREILMDDLRAGHGPDTNVQWLARQVMDCGERNKVTNDCRAYAVR